MSWDEVMPNLRTRIDELGLEEFSEKIMDMFELMDAFIEEGSGEEVEEVKIAAVVERLPEPTRGMVLEAIASPRPYKRGEEEEQLEALLGQFKLNHLYAERRRLESELRAARQAGDADRVSELLKMMAENFAARRDLSLEALRGPNSG